MPTSKTCGRGEKAKEFNYTGTVESGVTLHFSAPSKTFITAAFFLAIRNEFMGQKVAGGFSMDALPPGGLGEWVRDHSSELNGRVLTPRHASFIAAILRDAGWASPSFKGNAVYLQF